MFSLEDAIEEFANRQADAKGLSLEEYVLKQIDFLEKSIDIKINTEIVFAWLCRSYLEEQIHLLVSSLDCAEKKAFNKKKASIQQRYMVQHIYNIREEKDLDSILEKNNRSEWIATISALEYVLNPQTVALNFVGTRLALAEIQRQPESLFRPISTTYPSLPLRQMPCA